ncbi:hypothetical protein FACS189437_00900 [Bacteroidia bacterium]|nr:hypothetical protein FACS189437_00900 [Bacteroidia bacterium]
MQDNKELFEFLKIEDGGVEAKNINAVDRALGRQFAQMSPSQKTLDNIMAAARRRNESAFKKFFQQFTYRRILAGAAIVFILALIPGIMLKKNAEYADIYAYATTAAAGEITNLNYGLDEIISELDYMMEGNI